MKKIMKKDDYSKMPWVSADDLYFLFEQVIKDFKQSKLSKKEFFDILDELTMRQVDTYEILNEPVREQLDNELCSLWNTENYDDVDIITLLLISLGLKNTYNKMKKSIEDTSEISPEILEEIQDAIETVGDNIDNPYQDYMKKIDKSKIEEP
ncbi:hypothetical protein QJV03_02745 [Listeria swaminathanii]|uniref:Uncharacterized protein n=1 Tax=Listeria swaminathanii TaxID=2713501 RepID=A0ABU2ID39_9LIST|nr:hypothetical protein [Listeria swaminathanii]MCD2246775.1 hypothetical protein [Listeria marthii]MDT0016103.1 hypothetical protein [Listeria swaminathanii]MDT0021539.1 hypothetical protein [Listeria swaminathanii]MDT0032503.1 hypothetical protein [Listeria swaminathanii]MDT0051647.1 hypothetical protein [Listeria swaminathanii]